MALSFYFWVAQYMAVKTAALDIGTQLLALIIFDHKTLLLDQRIQHHRVVKPSQSLDWDLATEKISNFLLVPLPKASACVSFY